MKNFVLSSRYFSGITALITFSITSWRIWSFVASGSCCVEITTVSTRTGLSFSSYSTVTCDLASGRRYEISPDLRKSANFFTNLWESEIGNGINSGVSSIAKPNINPWSPAPIKSSGSWSTFPRTSSASLTPCAISGDCSTNDGWTPTDSAAKPYSALV